MLKQNSVTVCKGSILSRLQLTIYQQAEEIRKLLSLNYFISSSASLMFITSDVNTWWFIDTDIPLSQDFDWSNPGIIYLERSQKIF